MSRIFNLTLFSLFAFNLFIGQNICADNKEPMSLEELHKLAPYNPPVDMVMVFKEDRVLLLIKNGSIYRQYNISLGKDPVGQKHMEGDGRTPEGIYKISAKPVYSNFYLALQISYPNKVQRARAKKMGVDPGGNIMIHGMKNGLGFIGQFHTLRDWTSGCIAVTDTEIDEIYSLVKIGTPVHIYP